MLSEDFDKKIREAADRHHPSYDERAWGEMKKLLDKQMPVQEERKRRGLFILFFFLLLGGGAAIYFSGIRSTGKANIADRLPADKGSVVSKSPSPDSNGRVLEVKNSVPDQPAKVVARNTSDIVETKNDESRLVQNKKESAPEGKLRKKTSTDRSIGPPTAVWRSDAIRKDKSDRATHSPTVVAEKVFTEKNKTRSRNNSQPETPAGNSTPIKEAVSPPVLAITEKVSVKETAVGSAVSQTEIKTQAPNPQLMKNSPVEKIPATHPENNEEKNAQSKAARVKQVAKKKSSFFIAASAAPDVSFTSGDELGRLKLMGGIGIGFTYKGRLTLRSGFYTGRKIYTASPDNYKRTDWFNQYYPNLQKVEADCRVQEIPIALSYHFAPQGNHQFFASAGVSTLIMKEETYDYYYKYTAWGQVVNRSYTTYNQNKHPFSVLTVSAGYQYKMGKRFSVIAEPYLKLPLSGVGNGKVRLNSTGVMFTLTASPFGK